MGYSPLNALVSNIIKLIDSFQNPAPSDNAAFDIAQPPHWWIADIESWPDVELKLVNPPCEKSALVDHFPIFGLGNVDETLEIKQLLNIYRDLQLGHFVPSISLKSTSILGAS